MEQKMIDRLTIYGSVVMIIIALFFVIAISVGVRAWDDTYRYYNDHMTEFAILQFIAAFLVIQIAVYLLKLREACAASNNKQ